VKAARVDVAMVERGLAESRQKAQALVMAGRVRIAGVPRRWSSRRDRNTWAAGR
jgi:predicted rRNA methylase YqxC with S4 and FtsJ domains